MSSSIIYKHENIQSFLDLTSKAYYNLEKEIQNQLEINIKRNYETDVYYNSKIWYRILKYFVWLGGGYKQCPSFKNPDYDDYYLKQYEELYSWYENGRMDKLQSINEMALMALVDNCDINISRSDFDFISSFIE